MLPTESITNSKLLLETVISKSTLVTWKTKVSVSKIEGTPTSNKTIASREKFLIVMEAYTMSESDLGKYGKRMEYMLVKLRNGVLAA